MTSANQTKARRLASAYKLTTSELIADNRLGGIALRAHPEGLRCLICAGDMNRVGIVDICYTFEICSCDAAPYDHVREQLWHRKCFVKAQRRG